MHFPAEYEVESRNPVSLASIGREDINKAMKTRHHQLSGNKKKGSNSGHALYAADRAGGGHEKGRSRGNEND